MKTENKQDTAFSFRDKCISYEMVPENPGIPDKNQSWMEWMHPETDPFLR